MTAPAALRTDVTAGPAAGDGADWVAAEPALGGLAAATLRRLFRRGLPSWPWLVAIAVVVSGVRGFFAFRFPPLREATVVLRVSEGSETSREVPLGGGALRSYLGSVAFSSANLLALMKKAGRNAFPRAETDPVYALELFRDQIDIDVADNDFVQERGPNDPPRTVRLAITFAAPTPELAWSVAQQLAELVTGSTSSRERQTLEREQLAAATAAENAAIELERVKESAAGNPADNRARLEAAQERLTTARRRQVEMVLAVGAASEQQFLRFEVVDRGRLPKAADPVAGAASAFVGTLVIVMLVGWLLVGAFNRRVLDEEDLGLLGVASLGRLPVVPPPPPPSAPVPVPAD
jgi:hypothetical protein